MTKQNKKLFLLTFIIFLFMFEIFSGIVNAYIFNLDFKPTSNYLKNTKIFFKGSESLFKIYGDLFEGKKIQHPYFGYYYNPSKAQNVHGFSSEIKIPYEKKENDYIVGVFGGSYAQMFGNYIMFKDRERFVSDYIKNKPGKNIKIINFAFGGGRQPQQFIIATFFSHLLDEAIIIDGFNEYDSSYPRYPVSFPGGAEHYYKSEENAQVYNKIETIRSIKKVMDYIVKWPLVNLSQTVLTIWYSLSSYMYKLMLSLFADLEQSYTKSSRFTNDIEQNRDKLEVLLDNWTLYTQKTHKFLKHSGIKFRHIVQPNQVLNNSKLFSTEELQKYKVKNTGLEIFYVKIRERIKSFKNIKVYDGTMIYSKIKETVYIDSCCHVNDLGNSILLKYMIEDLK